MKDEKKTKRQLIQELEALRQQLARQQAPASLALSARQPANGLDDVLAQECDLLRTLMDNLPDAIYIKDTEGRFVMGNMALARLAGVAAPDHLLGKTDFDFTSPELAAQYYADEQRIIQTGQPLINREEPVIVQPNNDRLWHLTTKAPLRNDQGEIVGLIGVSRDITQRKLAELALQESEAKFRVCGWESYRVRGAAGYVGDSV